MCGRNRPSRRPGIRKINEEQAKIVREIFQRYAGGEGLRTIAKDLNARSVEPPKAGKRGTGSWSFTSIRAMVHRERYRGQLVWGKREKTYRGGTKVRIARPASDWVTIEVPELRIIDDELWAAVQRVTKAASARRARLHADLGRVTSSPASRAAPSAAALSR